MPKPLWKPGQSGNPKGRPKGSGPRKLFEEMIKGRKEGLLQKALDMAENGNENMMKFICSRVIPPPRVDEPIPDVDLSGDIKQKSESVVKALQDEKITPSQAKTLMDILAAHRANLTASDAETIVEVLKKNGLWVE